MKITNISIKKLFGLFDYNIDFNQEKHLTILTGPNGYGKTTILNIIRNLFEQNFAYSQKLIFEEIIISMEGDLQIQISKEPHIDIKNIHNNIDFHERVVSDPREDYNIRRGRQVFDNDIVISLIKDDESISTNRLNAMLSYDLHRNLARHPLIESSLYKYKESSIGAINFESFINDHIDILPENIIEMLNMHTRR